MDILKRTIIDVPTALPEQEVAAKIAAFLLENGFVKKRVYGEELYAKDPSLYQYFLTSHRHSYYFKIVFDKGVLHLEAFRLHKGWETAVTGGAYGRELLKKLQPILDEIRAN